MFTFLQELNRPVPADKHVSDWYVDLHNAIENLEQRLIAARRQIKDAPEDQVKTLQDTIVKWQTIIHQMEQDIQELGPEALSHENWPAQ